jgi:hypothetical protein
MKRPRVTSKKQRRALARRSPGPAPQPKGRPTPVSRRGWEVRVGKLWILAWPGHRPRVGGHHMTRYRRFGVVREVRPTEPD